MAGRKPFIPNPEHRKMVKAMAGYGITENDISRIITNPQTGNPIDGKTLRKYFRDELDTGEIIANAKVAESLYKYATQGNGSSSVTAAIFWLKTRARWRETDRLEVTGKDGGPIRHQALPMDLSILTNEELEAIEAIQIKLTSTPGADQI